jgi:hypothetical protein
MAYGKPTKIIDWAYQANHVAAGVARTIIKAFYGDRRRSTSLRNLGYRIIAILLRPVIH